MKITVVYDNIENEPIMTVDWEFSCFIKCKTIKIFKF